MNLVLLREPFVWAYDLLTMPIFLLSCCFVSTIIAGAVFVSHLTQWQNGNLQKCFLRVVLLVPLFSWLSWLSLRHPSIGAYCFIVSSFYEAYALWTVFCLMVIYAGGQRRVGWALLHRDKYLSCWGFSTCCTFHSEQRAIEVVKRMITQFTVLRPLMAVLLSVRSHQLASLNPRWDVLLSLVNLASSVLMVHAMLSIYMSCRFELAGLRAVRKILFISFIVFLRICEEIAMQVLLWQGSFAGADLDLTQQRQRAKQLLQSVEIIQMVLVAFMSAWAFGYNSQFTGVLDPPIRAVVPKASDFLYGSLDSTPVRTNGLSTFCSPGGSPTPHTFNGHMDYPLQSLANEEGSAQEGLFGSESDTNTQQPGAALRLVFKFGDIFLTPHLTTRNNINKHHNYVAEDFEAGSDATTSCMEESEGEREEQEQGSKVDSISHESIDVTADSGEDLAPLCSRGNGVVHARQLFKEAT